MKLTLALVSGAIICFVGVSNPSVSAIALAQPVANSQVSEVDRLFQQSAQQSQQGQLQEALKTLQRALELAQTLKDRFREAQALYEIGNTHFALQQHSQAIAAYRQAIPLFQELRNLSARDPSVGLIDFLIAQTYSKIGQSYSLLGEYAKSQTAFEQALALCQSLLERSQAARDSNMEKLTRQIIFVSYGTLGHNYLAQEQYEPALKYQQNALETARQLQDRKQEQASLESIITIHSLQSSVYLRQQNDERALESLQQGLKIAEESNFQYQQGMFLLTIGQIYVSRQDFTQALKYQNQAVVAAQQSKNRVVQTQVLFGRGTTYRKLSRYPEALADFQQAYDLLKATGDSIDVASMLLPIGQIYMAQNKYEQALNAYQKAEQAIGNDPFAQFSIGINASNVEQFCQIAQQVGSNGGLFSLADTCTSVYTLGTEALKRPYVLEGLNAVLKQRNRSLLTLKAGVLHSTGQLYLKQDNYRQASTYYHQALPILRQVGSPIQGATLSDLGVNYLLQGQYDQALNFSKQAVEVSRSFKHQINEEDALASYAIVAWAQGNIASALETFNQKAIVENEGLVNNLIIGSEEQKSTFVTGKTRSIDLNVSFHLQAAPNNAVAAKLAMNTVLQRKGRILDAVSDNLQRLRRNLKPEDQKLLDDLTASRAAYADLFYNQQSKLSANAFKAEVTNLKSRINNLENTLAQRSTEFRTQVQPVTIAATQALIPTDAALVEFVRYSAFNPKARSLSKQWEAPRYAAAILTRQGTQWVDLGEAKPIEQTIEQFRDRLQDPSNSENRSRNQLARDLDRQIMQPIRNYLGNTTHILISPDGALNLIPFEALKDEQDQYLIERYAFSYLTSGRDLIRFAAAPPSRQAPVVFSEIDYDRANQVAVKPNSTYRSISLASEKFAPLETAAETQEIKKAFPSAIVFRQQDATKTALQQIQAPLILHLATHGFFLPAQRQDEQQPISFRNNPLLRSGLILAGFNQRNQSAHRTDNSVLTALEATGLDLYGTQLVVLSACETGLGDPSVGEGIYGLRRALVIAGSQSQVLSLWKVRDDATGILMQQFYDNLKAGKGRHEALREAQLQLLRNANYQNPHYWAAFVPSGNWTALPKNK